MIKSTLFIPSLVLSIAIAGQLSADPCGMVPPIYNGSDPPIVRVGLQKTYVFHKDGIETFVIRPGFTGKVDEFGMLIPFPSVPSLRKAPDNIFEHIANAVDPPEVVIDLRPRLETLRRFSRAASDGAVGAEPEMKVLKEEEVRVIKQEAVGMYEVAVLAAGSPKALKKWMDQNGFKYPNGMDKVTGEYITENWCFVAVKTKVAEKDGVDPKPGQRGVDSKMEKGSSFDGFVQAMGFRFKTDELVVPMRLSTFNAGELRNVVYILTDSPQKINNIPAGHVVRQIPGAQLLKNVINPLPLRVIGGTEKDLQDHHLARLKIQRDPTPKNGLAKELFAGDLMAVQTGELSLNHEEIEKELLQISEHFGFRGADVDKLHAEVLKEKAKKSTGNSIEQLVNMTLTVVDGDFERDVLRRENLTFAKYEMPADRNHELKYDAKLYGPGKPKQGNRYHAGNVNPDSTEQLATSPLTTGKAVAAISLVGISFLFFGAAIMMHKRSRKLLAIFVAFVALAASAGGVLAEEKPAEKTAAKPAEKSLIGPHLEQLDDDETAADGIKEIVELAKEDSLRRQVIAELYDTATSGDDYVRRGWAIAAMSKIGGLDVDEKLIGIHSSVKQPMLVRTWAAGARVSMVSSPAALVERASLATTFPSVGRPIAMRLLEASTAEDSEVTVDQLIKLSIQTPALQQSLITPILSAGADKLAVAMVTSDDLNVRRQAAAYLGTLGGKDPESVAKAVIKVYEPNPMAEEVVWKGGPLYIPGIRWEKELGKQLVNNLITWNVWCEENGQSKEQQQIYNNLRSISLSRVIGYAVPGETGAIAWLKSWSAVVGKDGIRDILDVLQYRDKQKYKDLLASL